MRASRLFGPTLLLALGAAPMAAAQDSSQVATGQQIYSQFCIVCHGPDGKRGEGFQTPIWGQGALIAKFRTAQGMIDYMQIMPFNDPTLIDDAQRLAVTAFVLANHGAIPRNGELTPQNASSIPVK
jgi:mono/diheme cytochrome c family protein